MRAKFINEERMVHQPDAESMAFEIAQVVQSTYSGDDVVYETNQQDLSILQEIIEEYVETDDIEEMADVEWIKQNLSDDQISEIYTSLIDEGFINGGDFDDEDEPNDKFDLDQDIYDRNPDYDVDESVNEASSIEGDYAEAVWKMDKFMPDDFELQAEYYEILDDETKDEEQKIQELTEFFQEYADEEIMYRYFPKNGSISGFAKYIVDEEAV